MIRTLLCAICVLLAPPAPRKDIEAQYKAWAKAAVANDADGVIAILAPGYTLKAFDGSVITRENYEASLRKRKAAGQTSAEYTTAIKSLTCKGAEASVISEEVAIADTEDPLTHRKVKLMHLHEYLDKWVRIDEIWRLKSTVTQLEKTTIRP